MTDRTELSEAVARHLYKLTAYKDEYEVARLYTATDFLQRLGETFDGDLRPANTALITAKR